MLSVFGRVIILGANLDYLAQYCLQSRKEERWLLLILFETVSYPLWPKLSM